MLPPPPFPYEMGASSVSLSHELVHNSSSSCLQGLCAKTKEFTRAQLRRLLLSVVEGNKSRVDQDLMEVPAAVSSRSSSAGVLLPPTAAGCRVPPSSRSTPPRRGLTAAGDGPPTTWIASPCLAASSGHRRYRPAVLMMTDGVLASTTWRRQVEIWRILRSPDDDDLRKKSFAGRHYVGKLFEIMPKS